MWTQCASRIKSSMGPANQFNLHRHPKKLLLFLLPEWRRRRVSWLFLLINKQKESKKAKIFFFLKQQWEWLHHYSLTLDTEKKIVRLWITTFLCWPKTKINQSCRLSSLMNFLKNFHRSLLWMCPLFTRSFIDHLSEIINSSYWKSSEFFTFLSDWQVSSNKQIH